jgi:hypothetical protein
MGGTGIGTVVTSVAGQPTQTSICTEALKRYYNGATPNTTEITRAEDYGFAKVTRDIMLIGKKWKPLETTGFGVTSSGVSKYSLPSDCEEIKSVSIIKGLHTGLLTAVDNTTLYQYTLAADEDITEDEAVGALLLITSGTGANQALQIDDYSTATKIATCSASFTTAPVSGDGYMICNEQYNLDRQPIWRRDQITYPIQKARPSCFFTGSDATYGYMELYKCPDDVYGLQLRYFADLLRISTAGTLFSTILRRWAGVFEQGVYLWKLGEDDDRYSREFQIYDGMLKQLQKSDMEDYYNPNLQITVSD